MGLFGQETLTKTFLSKIKVVFIRVLAMKKKMVLAAAAVISVLLVTAISGTLLGLNFYPTEVKANDSAYHPNTLFEIPNEIRVEFYAASNEVPKFYNASEPSTPSYPFGEIVYLMLMRTRLRDGENPPIANVTISVSDDMGNVVWSRCIGLWGGGSGVSGGGGGIGVPWVSDAIGNYTAGVVFEGLIYDVPNDYSDVISIEICRSSLIFGKVTEKDEITAIGVALVEALVDGVQKSTAITDSEGAYTLTLRPESVYDIRASAPGYTPVIQRNVSTELETQCLNFSLAPIEEPGLEQQTPAKTDLNATLKVTSAFISLEPNVAEVNQTVRINMFIEPSPPTSAEVFQGIVLTITGPDGHIYAKGPYSTDSNGSQYEFFTPVQAGNYTFQFHYPGQLFTSEKIEYAATDSPLATLNVSPQPETSSPTALSTPNPILSPTASPASSPTPSQGASPIPKPQQSPTTLIVAASSMPVAVVCFGLLFYFRKRNTNRE